MSESRRWYSGPTLFLFATTAFSYAFVIGPVLAIALASLEAKPSYYFHFPPADPSFVWYTRIPHKYVEAAILSMGVATTIAILATIIGGMAAFGIVRGEFRFRAALETYFRVPLQIPVIVTAIAFLQFYNQLAMASGIDFLGSVEGLVLAHLFLAIPYGVSSIGVVLLRHGKRLDEAAESLGASPWTTFWRVTLPAIKPGVFAACFYAFVTSFSDVPIALFVAGGSDRVTLPVEIFQSLQFDFEPAILAISTLMVLGSMILVIVMQKLIGLDLVIPSNQTARR